MYRVGWLPKLHRTPFFLALSQSETATAEITIPCWCGLQLVSRCRWLDFEGSHTQDTIKWLAKKQETLSLTIVGRFRNGFIN